MSKDSLLTPEELDELLKSIKNDLWDEPTVEIQRPACECGSDKIKAPGHSAWCPKFKKG